MQRGRCENRGPKWNEKGNKNNSNCCYIVFKGDDRRCYRFQGFLSLRATLQWGIYFAIQGAEEMERGTDIDSKAFRALGEWGEALRSGED
jgi:hypothetical protein